MRMGRSGLTSPIRLRRKAARPHATSESLPRLSASPELSAPTGTGTLREQVAAFERSLIARALEEAGGNQSEAARRLGLTRVTLIDKLKRHGLRKG
ncbi:helix-turn-helix domain-containing protein [Hyalangium gracile]|uniref:helix-turn-helix domain-containing protein n=1 Tax=Hyalangium gracile TaxID=394092 RepID=UPI001CC9CA22|nr:helix-turn-helix domain-containing protein [Hyalangium gracile]